MTSEKVKEAEPTALKAVLAEAKRELISPEAVSTRLEASALTLAKAKKLKAQLFGIEAKAAQKVEERISELGEEHKRLKLIQKSGTKYPEVSLEVLNMRHANGLPKFALFALSSPTFEINSRDPIFGTISMEPALPAELARCYKDVPQTLRNLGQKLLKLYEKRWFASLVLAVGVLLFCSPIVLFSEDSRGRFPPYSILIALVSCVPILISAGLSLRRSRLFFSISAEYDGLMPAPVREKVREAKDDFDQIFVLSEVSEWQIEKVVQPVRDPLVLGWQGGRLFLIADYDTTPTEEYVKKEFAV